MLVVVVDVPTSPERSQTTNKSFRGMREILIGRGLRGDGGTHILAFSQWLECWIDLKIMINLISYRSNIGYHIS